MIGPALSRYREARLAHDRARDEVYARLLTADGVALRSAARRRQCAREDLIAARVELAARMLYLLALDLRGSA